MNNSYENESYIENILDGIRYTYQDLINLSGQDKVKYFRKEINKTKLALDCKDFSVSGLVFNNTSSSSKNSTNYYDFLNDPDERKKYVLFRHILSNMASELFFTSNRKKLNHQKGHTDVFYNEVEDFKRNYDYIVFQDMIESYIIVPLSHTHVLPTMLRLKDDFKNYILNKLNTELETANLYDEFYKDEFAVTTVENNTSEFLRKHEVIFKQGFHKDNYFRLIHYYTILEQIDSQNSDTTQDNFLTHMVPTLSFLIYMNSVVKENITPYYYIYNYDICFSLFDETIDFSTTGIDDYDILDNHTLLPLLHNMSEEYKNRSNVDHYSNIIRNSNIMNDVFDKVTFNTNLTLQDCYSIMSHSKELLHKNNRMFFNTILNYCCDDNSQILKFISGNDLKTFKRKLLNDVSKKCIVIDAKEFTTLINVNYSETNNNLKRYIEINENDVSKIMPYAKDVNLENSKIYYSHNISTYNNQIFFSNIFKHFELSLQRLEDKHKSNGGDSLINDALRFLYVDE